MKKTMMYLSVLLLSVLLLSACSTSEDLLPQATQEEIIIEPEEIVVNPESQKIADDQVSTFQTDEGLVTMPALNDMESEDIEEVASVESDIPAEVMSQFISTQAVSNLGKRVYSRTFTYSKGKWKYFRYGDLRNGCTYTVRTVPHYGNPNLYGFASSPTRRFTQSTRSRGIDQISYTRSKLRGNESRIFFNVHASSNTKYTIQVFRKCAATAPAKPAKPTLRTGSTSSPGPRYSSKSVTLRWGAASGAVKYGVYVRDVTTGRLVVRNSNVRGTSLRVNLIAGHKYRWNMIAFNSRGVTSGYTGVRHFNIKAATPVSSTPRITAVYGTKLGRTTLDIRGSGFQRGAKVFLRYDNNGHIYGNRASTYRSTTRLTLPTDLGTVASNWTFWVVNPNGKKSNTKTIRVGGATPPPSNNTTPRISSINPSQPIAKWGQQKIRLNGSNFGTRPSVTMTFGGRVYNLSSSSVRRISNSAVDIYVVLGSTPGRWTVKVKNGSKVSNTFNFNSRTQATTPPPANSNNIVQRAKVWVDRAISYNQSSYYMGYRQDCSGFIAYAWQLSGWIVTSNLKDHAIQISYNDLQPGDAINNQGIGNYGHVVMFVRWINKSAGTFVAYEENGYYGKTVQTNLTLQRRSDGSYTIREFELNSAAKGPYIFQRKK